MGFAPIVKREDQQEFEDFAYEYFDSRPDFPSSAGINTFGKGIWRFDKQGDDFWYAFTITIQVQMNINF